MKKINFFTYRILVNKKLFDKKHLKYLIDNFIFEFEEDKIIYYSFRKKEEKKYLMIACDYGKRMPYNENVYDTINKVNKKNTRKNTEVEQKEQLFILINKDNSTIYLSKSKMRKKVENYFSKILKLDVKLQSIYKNVDEFLKDLKILKSVRLTSLKDLTNFNLDLFKSAQNELGLGSPNQIEIKMDFDILTKIDNNLEKIKALFSSNKNQNKNIKSLIFIGENEDNMEMILNTNNFTKKIELNVIENQNKLIEPKEIFINLKNKIE